MKRDKGSIIVVTFLIIAVVAVIGTILIKNNMNKKEGTALEVGTYSEHGITEAYRIEDKDGNTVSYDVYITVQGYHGPIETKIKIDGEGTTLETLEIISQNETENLGAKITEASFLSQFTGLKLPSYLSGTENESDEKNETDNYFGNLGEGAKRIDGVYHAVSEEASNGYLGEVTLTIENGEITGVMWDCTDSEGNTKRVLSQQGLYKMTDDGLIWAEQADALQEYVVEHQGLSGLNEDENGKTDAVSGVSIGITEFSTLVRECLKQAAGGDETKQEAGEETNQTEGEETKEQQGTKVDAVSGATISSKAVVKAVNLAYEFVQKQ